MPALTAAVVALGVFFGGFVKATLGLGFGVASTPILSLVLNPRLAITILSIPSFVSSLWVAAQATRNWQALRPLGPLIIGILPGVILGAWALKVLPIRWVQLMVGILVVSYVATTLFNPEFQLPAGLVKPVGFIVGIVTGVLVSLGNIAGPILAIYLRSIGYVKLDFVFGVGAILTISTGGQVLSYAVTGLLGPTEALYGLLACIPLAIGMMLGFAFQARLSVQAYNRVLLTALFLLGLNLIVTGLVG